MKKYLAVLLLMFAVFLVVPQKTSAAGDFLKPTSTFSFLQSWKESLKMFFSFSKESKLNYLEELSNKRVSEIEDFGKNNAKLTEKLAAKYESNYKDMEKLTLQLQNKEQVAQKIEENSLRQQERLAAVYNQVPEQAKAAILNAQINSSKNTAAVIEKFSPDKAADYNQKIQVIQQLQMTQKTTMVEKESGNTGGNPGNNNPKPLNDTKDEKNLNQNSGNDNGQGQGSSGKAQPIQPAPMNPSSSQKK